MGLFGGIKKALFGGSGATGYQSPYTGQYEEGIARAAANRLGGKITKDAKGKMVYDFSGMTESPSIDTIKSPYQAKTFNFKSLPDEYYNQQYETGSSDIRRESQGDLERTQNALGIRNPGLLLKAQENNSRRLLENLARLKTSLANSAAAEKTNLAKEEQTAQADEDYRTAAFKTQFLDQERDNYDKALAYLLNLYGAGSNQSMQNAASKNQRSSGLFGAAVDLGKSYAKKQIGM